jgi:hypothetical protein
MAEFIPLFVEAGHARLSSRRQDMKLQDILAFANDI